ncbi:hypothetical protein COU49_02190 [Candidatus Nomurabacteria bacterium CG10_big_fil_rev_8_21_14_0_10_35_16]|uniref:Type II secretion system protein n=1 Tax=Candidatus Nomurabacteria bacterium CG10_big_fil_rev_8_21_14_0_10_35_16 TaxID=1974731 RepID=A0A2H0TCN2_9BACT|nr:MAG: hypothetical protein COU49_02190 [Candidatus Nomurabacteria bacterium CG10_big_fil_rev_8_21_14_0_10_35_16]
MKKFIQQKNTGFTLVETLIALAIFSVSILGLMTVLSQGISDTTYAKRKNIAAYLAQEGIEYMRNIRDTYVLYSEDGSIGWDAFKTKLISSPAKCHLDNGCYFDDQDLNYSNQAQPITGIYMIECGATCAPLLYDSSTGQYNYLTGDNSGFVRQITVDLISGDELGISSTVSWTQGSGTYQITFYENLFRWVE